MLTLFGITCSWTILIYKIFLVHAIIYNVISWRSIIFCFNLYTFLFNGSFRLICNLFHWVISARFPLIFILFNSFIGDSSTLVCNSLALDVLVAKTILFLYFFYFNLHYPLFSFPSSFIFFFRWRTVHQLFLSK
jgi:hypothetical protein